MISPEKIPTFTGDLGELQRDIIALRQAAKAIRENCSDVHSRFQNLSASYKAPEAGQLFGTTQAVQDTSGSFADRLETVAGALETYAVEVVEITKQLEMLRWQAGRFVESVKDDDGPLGNWRKDEEKVAEHQALWDGVNTAVAAFQQAEVTCADKITALVGGTQWHINDGSPKQENPYGFSAEQLSQAESLPWGTPEEREFLPFGVDHHLKEFGVGLWDNAAGTVEGLVDLFSPGEEGGAAREGLLRVIVGAEAYLVDPHGDRDLSPVMKKFMDDSKPYAKEFAKSFVGWDDWTTNPGKASATVVFNVLTLGVGPLKAGSAAKAGAASRVAGTLAKVGEVLDPIGAAAKTVGTAARSLPRVADLVAGVRGAPAAAAAADAAHSVLEFPDGSQLRIQDGEFIPGKKGEPDTTPAPHEPAAAERAPSIETPRQHELVGAGARTPDATAHAGENLPPQASHEAPSGGGPSHDNSTPHSGHAGVGDQHGGQKAGAQPHSGGGHGAETPDSGSSGHSEATPNVGGGDGTGHADDGHAGGEKPDTTTSGPMERGGEAERQLREGISNIPRNTMKPKVIEKIVQRLGESPSGREIADIIISGHLSQFPGYRDTVSMLGSGIADQAPRAMDQLRLADQFHKTGLQTIELEVKNPSIKADLDVRVTDDAGNTYGYQMKRLNNPKNPFDSITKPDNLGQLSKSAADHKIMLIDGQGSVAEWKARGIPEELLQVHRGEHPFKSEKGRGIMFVLRLDDGTIIIPPGSKVDPRGVL
ncbi:hypothetical protein [Streptomyces sp. CB03238]|uniref:hypothetical protein n=1 Tax=Streptomyces sp. CB03238 TaxID=1907777 RepID=UPI000A121E80|nr:hypothetical protein [Streptomyces sp. CB03238]ORT59280.1 hypothetical protein BKD26_14900 [Streptomyces sp. CB03238]